MPHRVDTVSIPVLVTDKKIKIYLDYRGSRRSQDADVTVVDRLSEWVDVV